MKIKMMLAVVLTFFICTSCIQDEPLNPEADILAFELPQSIVLGEAIFNQNQISVMVRKNADLSSLTPIIEITDGATITPAANVPQDFNTPVHYTVTAPDGTHQRTYTVQLVSSSLRAYRFENWEQSSPNYAYETPFEYNAEGVIVRPWDSSNKGIAIYQQYPTAAEYPIHPVEIRSEGHLAAEMITKVGPGSILGFLNIPIVAGSLFTGVLNPLDALKNPLLATRFGQPFNEKPLRMQGHYIYKAGAGDYIDPKGNVLPGVKDSCAIYGVFFRTDKDLQTLDGTNILTHPNILAIAMLPGAGRAGTSGEGFAFFDMPFVYKDNQEPDFANNNYKLAIIFSSSFYGDRYEGTPGSYLIVDDVKIIIEEK